MGFKLDIRYMLEVPRIILNNPHSKFYTQSLKEHLGQYFEQLNVPQEFSMDDKLSKLLELTDFYIEITNEGFLIQALNYGKSFNDQEEIGAGIEEQSATHSRPWEKAAHADLIIPPEPSATHVHVPPKPFPQSLQKDMSLSNTLLETGQMTTNTIYVVELVGPAIQACKFKENLGESYKQTMIHKETKKKLNGNLILHQEIRPMQKLWVLNTRFKSVRRRRKRCWKGYYFITTFHSCRRANMKDSTTSLKHIIDKHHLIPCLLLLYDAIKEWLITRE
ncbi:uncharacterized protein LOC126602588 [Malus sylvestris]|uniref:uncharacterized protein LOC126602588 n=1 Tax=Malus sylvestris TaxID=3752 RepID=UPI0021AC908C|nr:uncharacterized protein LOC126602588 [Malus sylvestris]